jgi:hypothetical protein
MGVTASEQTASRNWVVYVRHLVIERKGGPLVRPHIITYLSGARRVLVPLQLQKRAGTGFAVQAPRSLGNFKSLVFGAFRAAANNHQTAAAPHHRCNTGGNAFPLTTGEDDGQH